MSRAPKMAGFRGNTGKSQIWAGFYREIIFNGNLVEFYIFSESDPSRTIDNP